MTELGLLLEALRDSGKSLLRLAILTPHGDSRWETATVVELPSNGTRDFDKMVSGLDRSLSEFMLEVKKSQDPADTATIRHHAGDLILCGVAALKRLGRLDDLKELIPCQTS